MYLNIEKVLVKIDEDHPECTTLLVFSPHFRLGEEEKGRGVVTTRLLLSKASG